MTPKEKRNRYIKIAGFALGFDDDIYRMAQSKAIEITETETPITKDLLIKQFIKKVSDKKGLEPKPENMNFIIDIMEVTLEDGDKIRVSKNRITHFMFGNSMCVTEFHLTSDEYNNLEKHF